jgi:hypothetical protein
LLNIVELSLKAVSVPIGCRDHTIVAIVRTANFSKANPKIVYKIIAKKKL